jgi:cytidylate kinase
MCERINIHFKANGDNFAIFIDNDDVSTQIRLPEMDMLSSSVSAVPEVRKAMTALQRKIGEKGGIVAEGRDMGTVVFPDADFNFSLLRVQRYAPRGALMRGRPGMNVQI